MGLSSGPLEGSHSEVGPTMRHGLESISRSAKEMPPAPLFSGHRTEP